MPTPAEISAMAASGKTALEIATALGVHVRTVYKWLSKASKPENEQRPKVALPAGFDRAAAIAELLDVAIFAVQTDPSAENVASLARIARAARHAAHIPAAGGQVATEDVRERLLEKLSLGLENPPPHAMDEQRGAPQPEPPIDAPAPPGKQGNPWLSGVMRRDDTD